MPSHEATQNRKTRDIEADLIFGDAYILFTNMLTVVGRKICGMLYRLVDKQYLQQAGNWGNRYSI